VFGESALLDGQDATTTWLSLLLIDRIQDDFASGMIKQVEAQKFGAFAEQLEFHGLG